MYGSLSIPILLFPENGYPSKISYQLFLIDSKVLMVDLSYRSSLFYRFTVATGDRAPWTGSRDYG